MSDRILNMSMFHILAIIPNLAIWFYQKCIYSIVASGILSEAYDIRDIHMLSLLLLFIVKNMETLIFSWYK